jgi:membrane protease subunit (stomatin/prohibitin family)
MRDSEFGIVRATAFGIYTIRVKDAGIFIKDIAGTEGRFTTEQIQENLRGKIGLRIKEVLPELGLSIIDLEAKVTLLGQMLRDRIGPDFGAMGLELCEVQVQDVGLPEEVEKAIDKRGAIAAVGNLAAYTQYETASAIRDAATTPNSAAGAGMGLGAGIAMGAGMLPIAAGWGSSDGSFRSPMAVAVIGGLITSTLLSLLVVPAVYTFVDDAQSWVKRMNRKWRGEAVPPDAVNNRQRL